MFGWQARGARQASQARLPREGACGTAADGARVQGRLQGRRLRVQATLIVGVSVIEAERLLLLNYSTPPACESEIEL